MFEHEYFDVYLFEDIPIDAECWLIDECYMKDYEASWLDHFAGQALRSVGYVSSVATRRVDRNALDLSWYADHVSRLHEIPITLPRKEFVTCIGCCRYDENPNIFVKSSWLEQMYQKAFTVFCLVDAIGVARALRKGTLTRDRLIRLREAIDRLAEAHPNMCFISFADSLLIKSNWTVGYFLKKTPYTYNPEKYLEVISNLRAIYHEILDLEIYAILTQGTNEYYEDALVHISGTKNHVSLNSLGLPFAQILAIDTTAREAIRNKKHAPFQLYMDACFLHSLRLRYGFHRHDLPKYSYHAPLTDLPNHYYCAQVATIVENLEAIPKTQKGEGK